MRRLILVSSFLPWWPAPPERVPGAVRVGDPAPDFQLSPRGGGTAVRLSSFRGQSPVALIFGSYT